MRGIHIIFFLFLHENICCGYSLEAPYQGASNEYLQHMFSWRDKKHISAFRLNKLSYCRLFFSTFFTFNDNKSKMAQIDSLIFHFYNLPIKIKKSEKNISKNRIFRLVDYKISFRSSVTTGKSDCWSIVIDHWRQHYHTQTLQGTR